ncbi:MAG: hypothetical protein KME06_16015 [Kastovskya adunca ATA6-11-RM4]|jgi:hypothetical protein|nr:hypothetical protein [Kastovskya adunca ATA6-11-RM4]
MKPELQRIETTLNRLAQAKAGAKQQTATAVKSRSSQSSKRSRTNSPEPSFSMAVQPFPAHKYHGGKTPSLPKFKSPSFSDHRHAANPALAMNLLKEIEGVVGGWQKELQQILRQVQDIYLEGPIVDGWLDSHARESEMGGETVRHAETDRLMDYEEVLNQSDTNVTYQAPRTGYRLCGLDADGKLWSQPCPAEQVPDVSMAIARYHKLRQLLSRKQYLETRLSQLAETLIVLHSHLQE